MKQTVRIFAAAILAAAVGPAFGADPVYPPGSRVGMVPLLGLAPAKTFSGFETADHSVRVLTTELPTAAFGEVETAFKSNQPTPGAIRPESIETASGKGYYTIENARE